MEEFGDYQSVGDSVWTLDEAFHELPMQLQYLGVTSGFKGKAECTPYVSPGNQISHIATIEGTISIHNA